MKDSIQDQVEHNRITIDELHEECEKHGFDLHEDILAPIGYNTCDRCGDYGDVELDFLWVDSFAWDENNDGDHAVLNGIDIEGGDYCALCWGCVEELRKKGKLCESSKN